MERTIKSPDRADIEFNLITARQQQRGYEDMGETALASAWGRRADDLLDQWAALSGAGLLG